MGGGQDQLLGLVHVNAGEPGEVQCMGGLDRPAEASLRTGADKL